MRVTVIATGLDDRRVRRDLGNRETAATGHNVTPLRPEPSPEARSEAAPQPAAEHSERANREEQPLLAPDPNAPGGSAFVSPFDEDDEYDIPTFIRTRTKTADEDEDEPAFLRRSAD